MVIRSLADSSCNYSGRPGSRDVFSSFSGPVRGNFCLAGCMGARETDGQHSSESSMARVRICSTVVARSGPEEARRGRVVRKAFYYGSKALCSPEKDGSTCPDG